MDGSMQRIQLSAGSWHRDGSQMRLSSGRAVVYTSICGEVMSWQGCSDVISSSRVQAVGCIKCPSSRAISNCISEQGQLISQVQVFEWRQTLKFSQFASTAAASTVNARRLVMLPSVLLLHPRHHLGGQIPPARFALNQPPSLSVRLFVYLLNCEIMRDKKMGGKAATG